MTLSSITLNSEQIAFLQGNVVIYASSADANNRPHVVRATGARIDAANNTVTVFIGAPAAAPLLSDVRANKTLAVVFCEPGTEKAIQLKSHHAQIVNLQRDDQRLIADYCERMIEHISPVGFSPEMLRAFFSPLLSDAVAVQFAPCAAFDQTPGPNAGAALGNSL